MMDKQKPHKTVLRLGWVSLLNDLGSEVLVRLIPIYVVNVLGASMSSVGLIEGIAESTATVLKPIFGRWSDRLGERKIFLAWGYALSSLARPLLAMTGTWPEVAFLRFCDRFGKGIRTAPRDALIADVSRASERGRNFGINRALDTAGALAGVLAFGAWAAWRAQDARLSQSVWVGLVLACSVPGLLATALVVFGIREGGISASPGATVASKDSTTEASVAARGIRDEKVFIRYLGVITLFALANSSDAFILLRAKSAGYSLLQVLGMIALLNVVSAMTSIPAAALSDRLGRRSLIALGWSIYAAVYFALGSDTLAGHGPLLALALAIYGLFYGFTDGVERAWIADLVPHAELRGRAYGYFGLLTGLVALPASVAFGWAWDHYGATVPFRASAALALFAVGLLFILMPRAMPATITPRGDRTGAS